ncbi:hypothetical protein GGF31_008355 [Allomyces arbusculus]|nr:hypothetical protein GGF31_008355 [Allomyces arbusculus]
MPDVQFTARPNERADYEAWFVAHGGSVAADAIPVDGASAFFRQSGQPNDVLSSVWRLANRTASPSVLRFSDFCIAANLLLQLARGQLASPPVTLPPAFARDADRFAAAPVAPAAQQPTPFDLPAATTAPKPKAPVADLLVLDSDSDDGAPILSTRAPPATRAPLDVQRTGMRNGSVSRASTLAPAAPSSATGSSIAPLSAQRTGASVTAAPRAVPAARAMSVAGFDPLPARPASGAGTRSVATPPPSTFGGAPGAVASTTAWAIPADKQALYGGYFNNVDQDGKGFATANECYSFFLNSNLPPEDLRQIWSLVTFDAVPQLKKSDFVVAMHLIFERLAGKPIPDTLPADLVPPARRKPAATSAASPLPPRAATLATPAAPAVARASFDDIIGGGGAPDLASPVPKRPALATGAAAGLRSMSYAAPASPIASVPAPLPTARSTAAPGAPAALSQLPEAQELASLMQTTEALSRQRIETTTTINSLSIEKQNLMIRLGQVKATHDAEQALIESLKATLDQEQAATDALKDQVLALERTRNELDAEKRQMQQQMLDHRRQADQMRNRIVALNLEIQNMRNQLAKLKEEARREQDNYEYHAQSVQNIEETKAAVGAQLDAEVAKQQERATAKQLESAFPPAMSPKPAAATIVASPIPAPATIKRSTTPFDTELLALLDDAPAPMPAAAAAAPATPATPATPAPAPAAATTPAAKPATAASVSESLFDLTFPSPSNLPSLPVSPAPLPREVTDALAAAPTVSAATPFDAIVAAPTPGTPFAGPAPAPTTTAAPAAAVEPAKPAEAVAAPVVAASAEGGDAPAPAPSAAADPAEEDPVATVMALGFTREQAVDALDRYDNDPEKATNFLIDQAAQ